MEKVVNKNQNQHWLGADTAGYDDFRIKQMMPLPIGTTVMAVDVDEDDNVVMRDCDEISQPYCLVLTEDERGKTDIYPYNLSTDGGIDVRGTVIPNRHCPKCHKKMQPHMEEYEVGTLYYTCPCGCRELGDKQSPDIALGVDKGGAGDQGIMYGYATNETAEQIPIPYMVATKFLQLLKNHPSKMFRADAKAQVSYDYDTGRITTFLCSVQHSPDVEVSDFRHIIESMMVLAACEYGLDGDFTRLVNPTGRFVLGGSYADCGVIGRKLACDTYGGIGRMGGGALSGKDPTKVDRSAAYMARKIAKDIVQAGYADKCEVQLAYAIGVVQPVGVSVECFGTEHQPLDFIEAYVHDSYDLTPQGIIQRLGLLDVDYNKVSAYGHFGKAGLPWED